MKTFKEILKELTEARYISSAGYRIGPSGRKIKRRIKVGDDSYHQEDDLDKDGDVDNNDRRLAKEEVEQIDEGDSNKRLISKHGSGVYTAKVYHNKEYDEYSAHMFKNGKHMGEGPVSYHSDKQDAEDTAKSSILHRNKHDARNDYDHFYGKEKPLGEEVEQIDEATSVKTQKYSWGTMKTIHHGADFSIPLHPEHHEPIAKLGDDQEHKFKDETGKKWTAKRHGPDVHFQSGSMKTKVPHSTMQESTSKPVLLNEPEDKDVDTVTKDKDGKVTAWQHIGKWKKATHKDPSGVAPHLSDVALRKTMAMTKSEAFSADDKVGSTKPSPFGTYKKTDTGLTHTREYGDAKKDAADDKKYWDDAGKPEKKTRAKTGSFKRRFNTVAGRIAQGVK